MGGSATWTAAVLIHSNPNGEQFQYKRSVDSELSELPMNSFREASWWHGETRMIVDWTCISTLGGVVGVDAYIAIGEIASPHRGIACAGTQAHMYEHIFTAHVLT